MDKEGQLPRGPTSLNKADDTCVQVPPSVDVYAGVSCDTMAVASQQTVYINTSSALGDC